MADPIRLVNYRMSDALEWRAGVQLDARIVDVASCPGLEIDKGATVDSIVAAGPETVSQVLAGAQDVDRGESAVETEAAFLGPPILHPSKILCVGFNYRAHAQEFDVEVPEHPTLFAKFTNSLVGPYDPVRIPGVSREIDYEGELAVVIGKTCKDIDAADALGVVAGYTVFNDVTARDLQFRTSQFTSGKALDTFAPMGPGLVVADGVEPNSLRIRTSLNGDTVQDGSTALMIFSVAELIASVSHLMTLFPGDVIATGTPAGVGYKRTPPIFIQPGDRVDVEIEGIGRISNPFIDGIATGLHNRKETHDG